MTITTVGFDADDTLWHSESHFAVTEDKFRSLLQPWLAPDAVADLLLARERANLEIFGYGAKGFTLSMIETALEVSDGSLPPSAIQQIIDWGKDICCHPVELLDGVFDTVTSLQGHYRLMLITKGDLFHQESKVAESGLADHFDHVEILSEKSPQSYQAVLDRVGVGCEEFVMVGNSVRSDILPVVEIGAQAIHLPYGITWGHELVDVPSHEVRWVELNRMHDVPGAVHRLGSRLRSAKSA